MGTVISYPRSRPCQRIPSSTSYKTWILTPTNPHGLLHLTLQPISLDPPISLRLTSFFPLLRPQFFSISSAVSLYFLSYFLDYLRFIFSYVAVCLQALDSLHEVHQAQRTSLLRGGYCHGLGLRLRAQARGSDSDIWFQTRYS